MSAYPAIWREPRPAVGRAIWRNAGEVVLVEPGALRAPLTLTRAQASGAMSTALGADGVSWSEFAADVPRFHGASRRLLIAGQRTNAVRNPRCEGMSVPSTLPTNWSFLGTPVAWTVVGSGEENGIPYFDIRFAGTSTSSTSFLLVFETTTAVVASAGQAWTASAFFKLIGGSATNVNYSALAINERTSVGGFAFTEEIAFALTGAPLGVQRTSLARTLTGGTTARVTCSLALSVTSGNAIDATVRVGSPQIELGAFASSPILPPVGTPGASTRGADLLSASLTNLGLSGRFAVRGRFMLPQAAPSGADQLLFQVDDGTDNNRFRIRNLAGGNTIVAGRVTGGSAVDATSLGSMTPGREFEVLMVLDGLGGMAASLNGGTMRGVSGGPTSPTTLRVGGNAAGAMNLFGEIGLLAVAQL